MPRVNSGNGPPPTILRGDAGASAARDRENDAPAIEELAAGRDSDEYRPVTVLGNADGRGSPCSSSWHERMLAKTVRRLCRPNGSRVHARGRFLLPRALKFQRTTHEARKRRAATMFPDHFVNYVPDRSVRRRGRTRAGGQT